MPAAQFSSLILALAIAAIQAVPVSAQSAGARSRFVADAAPFLKSYCLRCHSTDKHEGEFDLERLAAAEKVGLDASAWRRVAEQLDTNEMPPASSKQPDKKSKDQFRAWVGNLLDDLARERAGDPGRVILRRLDNASYTYTLKDLLGVDLKPAKQFPADGAAGEGFTNAGGALAMSPALIDRYLDAAGEIAKHAVFLPDGIRFSPSTMRQDWANEILARIRAMYARHSSSEGASQVNLQGIVFQTNDGGRLPLKNYLQLLVQYRDKAKAGPANLQEMAKNAGLNPRYAKALLDALDASQPSWLLDQVRPVWKSGEPNTADKLAASIIPWQQALTRFQSVGHMKPWMVPPQFTTLKSDNAVTNNENTASWRTMPTTGGFLATAASQDLRVEIPTAPVGAGQTLFLSVGDAGDGPEGDLTVWSNPRLTLPGQKPIPLGDLRALVEERLARREKLLALTTNALAAAEEALNSRSEPNSAELAKKHGLDEPSLKAWFGFLGLSSGSSPALKYLTNKTTQGGGHAFVNGWSTGDLPSLATNSSAQTVRIPGVLKAHGVVVHPTPDRAVCVSWKSPVNGPLTITGAVKHAHPECGNGVSWSLDVLRGGSRQRLVGGIAHGGNPQAIGPVDQLPIRQGDLLTLAIGPRDGDHSCDLTDLELNIAGPDGKKWSLTGDVADTIHAGNPHADKLGNPNVWHFHSEPVSPGADGGLQIPGGSILAKWQTSGNAAERKKLAADLASLLTGKPPADAKNPDAQLFARMTALAGPLVSAAPPVSVDPSRLSASVWGIDPALMEKGRLAIQAPGQVSVRIPSELGQGLVFEASVALQPEQGASGSAQARVAVNDKSPLGGARPDSPVLVKPGTAKAKSVEEGMAAFRDLFPAALAYTKIVPVDEVVTLELFHREDEPLCRLMLTPEEKEELDSLWRQLHFVIRDKLTLVDAYNQLMEYATQDSNPKLFEHLRKPINEAAAAFRQEQKNAEQAHLRSVLLLADKAYRRPLTQDEKAAFADLFAKLKSSGMEPEQALRMVLVRVFASPHFIYRLERAPSGDKASAVTPNELATRLSYFLTSSLPDDKLRRAAAEGRLAQPADITREATRLLKTANADRLAREFACQWLHVYGFASMDEKSERHFPTFNALKADMEEEVVRFFTHLFQNDGSVLDILQGDRVWVNEAMARHYGIPGVQGADWRMIESAHRYGRGGILTMAATLAKQSGASRTSPILRGNWVSEALLGERLPRPPKDVPRLPEDEAATEGKTVRELVQMHSSDPRCAGCHVRIDPFGFSLEGFDAIGRARSKDLGERPIDTKTKTRDGVELEGSEGLEKYLAVDRRAAFIHQFCKKLLGYALGREVQVADEPTLAAMKKALEENGHKFSAALKVVVESPQFRTIRGAAALDNP